jgi:hypothetical protein
MVFYDLGDFHGKVKVTLKNQDKHITLFSESVSLKNDKQGNSKV